MKRKYRKPEQIVHMLREIEAKLSTGQNIEDVCRELGINDSTYYYWRKQYGRMEMSQLRQLKELQKENLKLKKLIAEQALDIAILKETLRGNY